MLAFQGSGSSVLGLSVVGTVGLQLRRDTSESACCPVWSCCSGSFEPEGLLALCGLGEVFVSQLPCLFFPSLVEFSCVSAVGCPAPGSRSPGLWSRKPWWHNRVPLSSRAWEATAVAASLLWRHVRVHMYWSW